MNDNLLFSCLYGSRLYGTSTPTSDLDWKHIVLPPLDSLLLGNGVKNKDKKTNTEKNARNTQDDVDETFIPIQAFARDYYAGQTYALELAWAMEGDHAKQTFGIIGDTDALRWYSVTGDTKHLYFYQFVRELREKFLTSNIKAMMGYAVNQASLYSFKGERLNVVREAAMIFAHADEYYKEDGLQLKDFLGAPKFAGLFADLAAKYPKYFRIQDYDIGAGVMKPCYYILEKCLPHTNTIKHTMDVLDTLIKKYGTRANEASADNVDWKAMMHALRICNQGVKLLETGRISFPFEQAYVDKLLSIKRGEVPLEVVTTELNQKLDKLKELEVSSTLTPASPERRADLDLWLAAWMRRFYNIT